MQTLMEDTAWGPSTGRRTRTDRLSVGAGGVHAGPRNATVRGETALGRRLAGRHTQPRLTDHGCSAAAAIGAGCARGAAHGVHAELGRAAVGVAAALWTRPVVGPANSGLALIMRAAFGVSAATEMAGTVEARPTGGAAAVSVVHALPRGHGILLTEAHQADVTGSTIGAAGAGALAAAVLAAGADSALAVEAARRCCARSSWLAQTRDAAVARGTVGVPRANGPDRDGPGAPSTPTPPCTSGSGAAGAAAPGSAASGATGAGRHAGRPCVAPGTGGAILGAGAGAGEDALTGVRAAVPARAAVRI